MSMTNNPERNMRSKCAIENFEVPLNFFTAEILEDFLDYVFDDFTKDDMKFLRRVSVNKWVYVAVYRGIKSEWHDTSLYFNHTHHYDLKAIANRLLELQDTLEDDYRTYTMAQKDQNLVYFYGVAMIHVFGGSATNPEIDEYKTLAGIILGNTLYFNHNHASRGTLHSLNLDAPTVEWSREYATYEQLVDSHPDYKDTEIVFDKILHAKLNL